MKVGDVIASKYLLVARVGQGGMGSVWRVEHTQTGREFAVKVLHPSVQTSEDSRHRFMLEARASAKINHSNIIDIFDIGETEDGALYLVMELLDGIALSDALRCDPPFNARELLHLISGVATALAAAHGAGVVHRDIKPPNIFLHRDRASGYVVAKILDFGVSKVLAGDDGISTHTGSLLGSPRYMAPEQAHSATAADGRSDIWSLGVVLFEALTGRFPHDGDSSSSLVIAIGTKPPKSIHSVAPQLALPLRLLVDDCLKPQDERIQSAEIFVDRIQTILATNDLTDVVLARSSIGRGKVQPRPEGFTIRTIAPNAVGISSLSGRIPTGSITSAGAPFVSPAAVGPSLITPLPVSRPPLSQRPKPPPPSRDADEQTVMRIGIEDAIEEQAAPPPPRSLRPTLSGRPPQPPPPARTSVPSIRPPQIAKLATKSMPPEVTKTVAQPTSPRPALPFGGTLLMQEPVPLPDARPQSGLRGAAAQQPQPAQPPPAARAAQPSDPGEGLDEATRIMPSPLANDAGESTRLLSTPMPAPQVPYGQRPPPPAPPPPDAPVDPTFESISSINVATGHRGVLGESSLAAPMISPLARPPRKKIGVSTIVALVGAFSLMVFLVGLVIQQSREMSAEPSPVAVHADGKSPAARPADPPKEEKIVPAVETTEVKPAATASPDVTTSLDDAAASATAVASVAVAPPPPPTPPPVTPATGAVTPKQTSTPKPKPTASTKPKCTDKLDCLGSGINE